MNDSLTPEREARRDSIKGLSRITYEGPLTKEVVEDIVAAAPHVQILTIEVFDDTSFELSILKELKDLLMLKILEGSDLIHIKLEGIQELDLLTGFEINVNPEESIQEIDLTPLTNHPTLHAVTVAGPVKNLKGLAVLKTIPNFGSLGLYSFDVSELDLTPLSGCEELESIYLSDMGPEDPIESYKLTIPRNIPLKILEVSECYSEELALDVDFSFVQDIKSLDSLSLKNCNLTSFDFCSISPLERIGSIDLSENKITHMDITPILETPTFTEKALGRQAFVIDPDVIIQIEKKKQEEIPRILEQPDTVVESHDGSFAIEYEFGHQWLKKLLDTHSVEWI